MTLSLAVIDRRRAQLRKQFNRAMAKLEDQEREALGLRALKRDHNGMIIGFLDDANGEQTSVCPYCDNDGGTRCIKPGCPNT